MTADDLVARWRTFPDAEAVVWQDRGVRAAARAYFTVTVGLVAARVKPLFRNNRNSYVPVC